MALRLRKVRIFAAAAPIEAMAAGALVLLGYRFALRGLTGLLPGAANMSVQTALCLLVAGVALYALAGIDNRPSAAPLAKLASVRVKVAEVCAVLLIAITLLSLADFAASGRIGFGAWLEQSSPLDSGRMAPATSASLAIFGATLLLARGRLRDAFHVSIFISGLSAWLGISHYFFGGKPAAPFDRMAIHTAFSLLILNAGALCLRTDWGFMSLLVSDGAGGLAARRLVPVTLISPLIISWIRLQAQRAGWVGMEDGVSLVALSNIVIFGGFIWRTAAFLHDSQSEHKRSELRVFAQLERLDLLRQITRAIGERQDTRSIFQALIRRLEEQFPLDFCSVCLYLPGGAEVTVAAVGVNSATLAKTLTLPHPAQIAIDANGLSRSIQGHLIYEPDLNAIPYPFAKQLSSGGLRSLIVSPLAVESQVFGLLLAAREESHSFSSSDCEFMKQLSEHAALAAHQADLHSALKKAYDELRATQDAILQQERLRALGQMASGIAHDINNAISPVALYTDMLLEKEPNLSNRTRQYLEVCKRSMADVAHTVSRMQEFYRQSKAELQLTPLDLNLLVEQVVELTEAKWRDMPQQRGIVIDVRQDLAPRLPPIAGIESELRECLTNLIFNAVDAMPEGGVITLKTRALRGNSNSAGEVQLEVGDTGIGMSEETRLRCLEPFFTTKGERGTGLGLAMVYGIVRRHSADIAIDSTPGVGTTFRIAFAAAAHAPQDAPEQSGPAIPVRRRILIVDDDPLLIDSVRDALENDGHWVTTALGGQEGIDAFRTAHAGSEPFDVVITDLGMPYVDGHKVAAAVKTASPETPVLLLTGWGQRLIADAEIPPNVDRVLSKPPKLSELRAALAQTALASVAAGRA